MFVTTDHGRARSFCDHGGDPESAAVWLVAWGPSIKARGELVTGKTHRLSDLAPTARNILGLHAAPPAASSGVVLAELLNAEM